MFYIATNTNKLQSQGESLFIFVIDILKQSEMKIN